jgi:hypothetical protein
VVAVVEDMEQMAVLPDQVVLELAVAITVALAITAHLQHQTQVVVVVELVTDRLAVTELQASSSSLTLPHNSLAAVSSRQVAATSFTHSRPLGHWFQLRLLQRHTLLLLAAVAVVRATVVMVAVVAELVVC